MWASCNVFNAVCNTDISINDFSHSIVPTLVNIFGFVACPTHVLPLGHGCVHFNSGCLQSKTAPPANADDVPTNAIAAIAATAARLNALTSFIAAPFSVARLMDESGLAGKPDEVLA
jgi:hypothetical protein